MLFNFIKQISYHYMINNQDDIELPRRKRTGYQNISQRKVNASRGGEYNPERFKKEVPYADLCRDRFGRNAYGCPWN